MRADLPILPPKKRITEYFFASYLLLFATLLCVGGRRIAYWGLDLNELGLSFGVRRLHFFELNLLALAALSAFWPKRWADLARSRDVLVWGVIGGFVLLAAHFLLGFRGNFYLFLRNSFFLWAFAFSLIMAVIPALNVRVLERVLVFCSYLFCAVGAVSLAQCVIHGVAPAWQGVPLLFVALCFSIQGRTGPLWMRLAVLAILAVAAGYSFHFKFPRLLIVLFTLALVVSAYRWGRGGWRPLALRLLVSVLAFGLGWSIAPRGEATSAVAVFSQSMDKSEAGRFGVDAFRWYLWQDAWEKFAEKPLAGIGMEEQVVSRLYVGKGLFKPNTGGWETPVSPPVSGPHNSYLNAIARLGIWGVILPLLFLATMWRLFSRGYPALGYAFLAQAVYALLNVGLEGPVHIIFLVIGVGCAIRIQWDPPSA